MAGGYGEEGSFDVWGNPIAYNPKFVFDPVYGTARIGEEGLPGTLTLDEMKAKISKYGYAPGIDMDLINKNIALNPEDKVYGAQTMANALAKSIQYNDWMDYRAALTPQQRTAMDQIGADWNDPFYRNVRFLDNGNIIKSEFGGEGAAGAQYVADNPESDLWYGKYDTGGNVKDWTYQEGIQTTGNEFAPVFVGLGTLLTGGMLAPLAAGMGIAGGAALGAGLGGASSALNSALSPGGFDIGKTLTGAAMGGLGGAISSGIGSLANGGLGGFESGASYFPVEEATGAIPSVWDEAANIAYGLDGNIFNYEPSNLASELYGAGDEVFNYVPGVTDEEWANYFDNIDLSGWNPSDEATNLDPIIDAIEESAGVSESSNAPSPSSLAKEALKIAMKLSQSGSAPSGTSGTSAAGSNPYASLVSGMMGAGAGGIPQLASPYMQYTPNPYAPVMPQVQQARTMTPKLNDYRVNWSDDFGDYSNLDPSVLQTLAQYLS